MNIHNTKIIQLERKKFNSIMPFSCLKITVVDGDGAQYEINMFHETYEGIEMEDKGVSYIDLFENNRS